MRRRAYLAGSIAIVGSLAGCSGILGDSDDSESEPDRGPSAPSVQWDGTERTNDDGRVTEAAFVHSGGDDVDPTTLSATADGSTVGASGATSTVTVGTAVVVPFDGDGESVGIGATVELRWADPDDGSTQTLTSFTLSDDTAGSPGEQLRIE